MTELIEDCLSAYTLLLVNKSPGLPGGLLILQVRNTACFKALRTDVVAAEGLFSCNLIWRKEALSPLIRLPFFRVLFTWTCLISLLLCSCFGVQWNDHISAIWGIFVPSCLLPFFSLLHSPIFSITCILFPAYFSPSFLSFPNIFFLRHSSTLSLLFIVSSSYLAPSFTTHCCTFFYFSFIHLPCLIFSFLSIFASPLSPFLTLHISLLSIAWGAYQDLVAEHLT